jgi:hypothetical protein
LSELLELLEELREGGWRLEVEEDRLKVTGRPLEPELREKIKENRDQIIRSLKIIEIAERFRRVFGDGIKVLPPDTQKTCYACGGTLFWISKLNGHLYCTTCHPPATPDIVAGWRGKEKEPDLKERQPAVQIDYQKPACMWCLAGKNLNCPDCEGGIKK